MINFQKIIKYFAIAFAMFLIVSIISGIIYGLSTVGIIFTNSNNITTEMKTTSINSDINSLEIDINSSDLTIKSGDMLTIETNNSDINIIEEAELLSIKEKKNNILSTKNSKLIITLPDKIYNTLAINIGAGKVNIEKINANSGTIELGAGNIVIDDIIIEKSLNLENGAGDLNIRNGIINNLDLSIGAGSVTLKSKVLGNSKLDCGVGKVNLDLIETKEDYTLKISKGVGTITVADEKVKENYNYGTGINSIVIDGGVGKVKVNFSE